MTTTRTEAFSDGVFAIAATLLVLDLISKIPGRGSELGAALLSAWPAYVTYVVSFLTIGIIWVNHHGVFDRVGRMDRPLQFMNLILLMVVAVIPFPTALLAARLQGGGEESLAAAVYAGTFMLMAFAFSAIWVYAVLRQGLLHESVHPGRARSSLLRFALGTPGYPLAVVVSLFSARLGLLICAGLAVFYLFDTLPPISTGSAPAGGEAGPGRAGPQGG